MRTEGVDVERSADLCWGQQYILLSHYQLPRQARHELNLVDSHRPPAGATVGSLRLALNEIVRRHEALRTTIDLCGKDGPVQRVSPPRPVPVACFEADGVARAEVTRFITELTTTEFQLTREWPIRIGIVTTRSTPTLMVFVGHHSALDDYALEILKREFAELHSGILAGRPAYLAPVRYQPVELARDQSSSDAQRQAARSLAYWDHVLSRVPADVFRDRRTSAGAEPAYSASLSSPAALDAARELASQLKVWPSFICTAVFTAILAGYTGSTRIFFHKYLHNRGSEARADTVACLFQPALVDVDCTGDPPFLELVDRTQQQVGRALASAYCPYDRVRELVCVHSARRGVGLRVASAFNYLRHGHNVRGGSRTMLAWNATPSSWAELDTDAYLRVAEWQDCLVATLNAKSVVLNRDGVERFLRGFERLLTCLAEAGAGARISELAATIGFAPPPAGQDAVTVDHTVVSPREVDACLQEHPSVRLAKTFVERSASGDVHLTAYIATGTPAVTPTELRTHLLGRIYDFDQLRCPDRFVVCTRTPSQPDSAQAWARLEVAEDGDGRDGPTHPPRGAPERALAAAVCEVNDLTAVGMEQSYVTAGGRVMRIPRLQEVLESAGWQSPTLHDVASALPLRALASRLARTSPEETVR